MGYLDDLKQLERDRPADGKTFTKKAPDKQLETPDKLADYRDQRLNRRDGPGSYEPEVV